MGYVTIDAVVFTTTMDDPVVINRLVAECNDALQRIAVEGKLGELNIDFTGSANIQAVEKGTSSLHHGRSFLILFRIRADFHKNIWGSNFPHNL